jgi:hypothetical protein
VSRVFGAQNVIHVEDVVALLVVVAIILHTLAGLGQNPPWVPGRLVFETGIADSVGRRQLRRQCLQRLERLDHDSKGDSTNAEKTALGLGPTKRRLIVDFWLQLRDVRALCEFWRRSFDDRHRLDLLRLARRGERQIPGIRRKRQRRRGRMVR